MTAIPPRYEVHRELGRGGMGKVLAAHDRELDRAVALKVILRELRGEDESVRRFHREAQAAMQLRHEGLVRVLDFGKTSAGTLYFTMELLDAQHLQAALEERGLIDGATATDWLAQAAGAVAHLHEHGMVHRDLKPTNMMVDAAGHVKVMDLGLVHIDGRSALTEPGSVFGTPLYMAPEAISVGVQSAPGDVYGLGISFWQLLAGRRPYRGTSDVAMLQWIVQEGPEPLGNACPSASRGLAALIDQMCARRPEDRPTAREVHDRCRALQAPAADERATVQLPRSRGKSRGDGASTPAARPATPRAWRLALIPLGALGALAAIAGALHWRGHPPAPLPVTAPAHPARLVTLTAEPEPPHALRLHWELDCRPPDGFPLAVAVNDVARAPLTLVSVEGSMVLTGVPADAEVVLGGATHVRMPRGLPAWTDLRRSDRTAHLRVQTIETVELNFKVTEQTSGRVVRTAHSGPGDRHELALTGLTPATKYQVFITPAIPSLYMIPDLTDFLIETHSQVAADEQRRLVADLIGKPPRYGAAHLLEFVPDDKNLAGVSSLLTDPAFIAEAGPEAVKRLAFTLCRTRDPRALPVLAATLASQADPAQRAELLLRIHELGTPEAFDLVLAETARGALPVTATAIAGALIQCDPARARLLFDTSLEKPAGTSLALRQVAVANVARLDPAGAVPLLRGFLTAADGLDAGAARALGVCGGREARAALTARLAAPASPALAVAALAALARCGEAADAPAALALAAPTQPPAVRRMALWALAGCRARSPAISRAIADALGDADAGVVQGASAAAGAVRDPALVPALVAALLRPGGTAGRAPRALGLTGDASAVPALLALAEQFAAPGDPLDRADALWALGRLGVRSAVPLCAQALATGDVYTRVRAAEALAWIADPPARAAIFQALQDQTQPLPVLETLRTVSRWQNAGWLANPDLLVIVDPAFPAARTGIALALGDGYDAEPAGLLVLKPGKPDTVRGARASLCGVVGVADHAHLMNQYLSPSRFEQGELLLYADQPEGTPEAAGFLTVRLAR